MSICIRSTGTSNNKFILNFLAPWREAFADQSSLRPGDLCGKDFFCAVYYPGDFAQHDFHMPLLAMALL